MHSQKLTLSRDQPEVPNTFLDVDPQFYRDTFNFESVQDYGFTSRSFAKEVSTKKSAKDDNDIKRDSSLLNNFDDSIRKSTGTNKQSHSPKVQ